MTDERPRYAHWFRCRTCGGRFSVTRLTADPLKVKTPACPKKRCGGRVKSSHQADIPMDVAAGKAPGVIGAPDVVAYDMAMDAAAHNAGLTNLVDKPRYGESSVPKLPPALQEKADNFWGKPAGAKTVRKRVDLSGLYGERATAAQAASPIPGMSNVAAMPGVKVSDIVNRPGAPPPINIVAST